MRLAAATAPQVSFEILRILHEIVETGPALALGQNGGERDGHLSSDRLTPLDSSAHACIVSGQAGQQFHETRTATRGHTLLSRCYARR
jgi:hypothetical protein